MKNRKPISRILSVIDERSEKNNTPAISIAIVSSPPPNLKIKYKNIEIDKKNLLVSDFLLKDYIRKFETVETKVTLSNKTDSAMAGVTGQATESPTGHTHPINWKQQNINLQGQIKFTDTLKKDDELAVIPTADYQQFIILCKVVRL